MARWRNLNKRQRKAFGGNKKAFKRYKRRVPKAKRRNLSSSPEPRHATRPAQQQSEVKDLKRYKRRKSKSKRRKPSPPPAPRSAQQQAKAKAKTWSDLNDRQRKKFDNNKTTFKQTKKAVRASGGDVTNFKQIKKRRRIDASQPRPQPQPRPRPQPQPQPQPRPQPQRQAQQQRKQTPTQSAPNQLTRPTYETSGGGRPEPSQGPTQEELDAKYEKQRDEERAYARRQQAMSVVNSQRRGSRVSQMVQMDANAGLNRSFAQPRASNFMDKKYNFNQK